MTTQLAARDPLCHLQAGRPDLLGPVPLPGGDQVNQYDAPALDGIDGSTAFAELRVGLLQWSAEVGHCADTVRRECQQHHPLRRQLCKGLHIPTQPRPDGVRGCGDVVDTGPVHQDCRIQSGFQSNQDGVRLLPMPSAARIVGDRHQQVDQSVHGFVVQCVGLGQGVQDSPVG